jgi:hypothetical protein
MFTMIRPYFVHPSRLITVWLLAALCSLVTSAQAQTSELLPGDPPSQVARLNLAEGAISMAVGSGQDNPAEANAAARSSQPVWQAAELNWPLTSGDLLWSDKGGRAELHIGSTALRLSELTSLDLLRLDDRAMALRLNEGSLRLRVRNLYDGQRLNISTPNLAFTVTQPGDYRLDVNRASDTTRVVVQAGAGLIQGDSPGAEPLTINAQQQGSFSGGDLATAAPGSALQDSFDAWVVARDRQEDQSATARYVPREVVGYQQLDRYGDWQQDATLGAVWLPRNVSANWAPYREGQWRWVAPWGWTWVDSAPWGFAPFHYGRWAQVGPRWGWVPGRLAPRPVYAPALVGFVGTTPGPRDYSVHPGASGWFPLAPGEAYRPGYRASPRYVTQVNHNTVVSPLAGDFRYQRQANAISRANADDWGRGRGARPADGPRPPNYRPIARTPIGSPQIGQLSGGPVLTQGNGTQPAGAFNRGNDSLLEADIQARRDQFRLQQQQRRQQEGLARQQEAQRQRDQAPVGERALQMQQEQADRIGRQVQDAQRLDFQRAQQQRLQEQRIQPQPFPRPQTPPQFQLQPPESVGRQAMREQAQRQQESNERIRAQQADRPGRDAGRPRGMPGPMQDR